MLWLGPSIAALRYVIPVLWMTSMFSYGGVTLLHQIANAPASVASSSSSLQLASLAVSL